MEDKRLQIILEAVDETRQSFKSVTDSLKALQESAKKVEDTNKETQKLTSGFKELGKAAVGLFALDTVVNFLRSTVTEAAKAQEVTTRLAQTMKTAVGASDEQIASLTRQADALAKVTTASDDAIISAQAKLATFDLQAESIERVIPALLDYTVGENGAIVTTEQLMGAANGLGKALQGQTDVLTKGGFKFTETQINLLKTGTETERVTALTEILNSTYEGAAEAAGRTFTGSLEILRHKLDDIKEGIGKALLPAIVELMNGFSGVVDGMSNLGITSEYVGKVLYTFVKILQTITSALETVIIGAAAVGDMLFSVAKGGISAMKALWDAGKGGNFDGFTDSLTATWDEIMGKATEWGEVITEATADVGAAWDEAMNQTNYKPIVNDMSKVAAETKGLGDEAAEVSKETAKALESLGSAYDSFTENADNDLFELKQSHKDALASIKADIMAVKDEMRSLDADFASGRTGDNKTVAEAIVANEQRVTDIQAELATKLSADRRTELNAELAERQAAVLANAEFISSLEAEVAEARRVAGLSELERAIEEYNQKRALAQAEYDEKMTNLRSELKELKKKREEENELYEMKREFIKSIEQQIAESHKALLESQVTATKAAIDKEIDYYRKLASVIDAARSGDVAGVKRAMTKTEKVNDAIITPQGKIITTHPDDWLIATKNPAGLGGGSNIIVNVTGNQLLDDRAGEKIANAMLGALKLNVKI